MKQLDTFKQENANEKMELNNYKKENLELRNDLKKVAEQLKLVISKKAEGSKSSEQIIQPAASPMLVDRTEIKTVLS